MADLDERTRTGGRSARRAANRHSRPNRNPGAPLRPGGFTSHGGSQGSDHHTPHAREQARQHENQAIDATKAGKPQDSGKPKKDFAPTIDPDDDKKSKAKFKGSLKQRKRQAYFFLFSTTGAWGLALTFFTFFSAPLQIIHFAETLLQNHMEHVQELGDRAMARRILNRGDPSDRARRKRLGVVANALADRIEAQWKTNGIELEYNKATGRLERYRITNDTARQELIRRKFCSKPCDVVRATGNIRKDRKLVKGVIRASGTGRIAIAAHDGIMTKRYGLSRKLFSSWRNWAEDLANSGRNRVYEARERARARALEWNENVKNENIRKQGRRILQGKKRRVGDIEDIDESDSDSQARTKVKNALRVGAQPLELFSLLCTVRQLGKIAADQDVRTYIAGTIAVGRIIVNGGHQVKGGDFDINQLELLSQQFFGQNPEDAKKRSWVESDSLRRQSGTGVAGIVPTERYEEYTLNSQGNRIDSVFRSFPGFVGSSLGSVCDKVLSTLGQIAVTIVGGLFRLTGVGFLASVAVEEVVNFIAGDAIANAVVGLLRNEPIPPEAKGALLGFLADSGAFHSANQQTASLGGVALTPEEEEGRVKPLRQINAQLHQEKPFAQRYFDIENTQSFTGQLAMRTYTFAPTASEARNKAGSIVANILTSPMQLFRSEKASALPGELVTQDYFQTVRYGFSEEELESPEFDPIDPATGWPLPMGEVLNRLARSLDEKVAQSVQAQQSLCLISNIPSNCKINPGLLGEQGGDAAQEVLNNNMNPAPYGYKSSGNYLESYSAVCTGNIIYDNLDLHGGGTRVFQRDDAQFVAATVKGESLRPDMCDTGEGIEITVKADPKYRAGGDDWDINEAKLTLDPQTDHAHYRAGLKEAGLLTGDGCAFSTSKRLVEGELSETKSTDPMLQQLCQDLGYVIDENNTTEEAIDDWSRIWSTDHLQPIDEQLIFDTEFAPEDSGAVHGDHNIPCEAGSQNTGVVGSNVQTGATATFNTCNLGGNIVVNSSISGNIAWLIAQARKDGVILSATSSFRTRAEQEYFYMCYQTGNCNNGNLAARPGTSNHEGGFAIDFTRPSIAWLQQNMDLVAQAGLSAKVASEDWHFSINGR